MSTAQLLDASLPALRPTQMTIGLLEVVARKEKLGAMARAKRTEYIDAHVFPAIRGPEGVLYIVDHHHLGRALLELGIDQGKLMLLRDLSMLPLEEFWLIMEHCQWVHPYDGQGVRRTPADLPASLPQMADDPYRSLAGAVCRAGGFLKNTQPFAEFLWADFFRRRLPPVLLADDLKNACRQALSLAHSPQAAHLPGWCAA